MRRLLYLVLIAGNLMVAGFLSHRFHARTGLAGFGAGAALGLILCGLSHHFWKIARVAEGHAVVRAVMTSLIATFGILMGSIVVVRLFLSDVLQLHCFALTAVSVYLVHRFFEALVAGARPVARTPTPTPTPARERGESHDG